MTSVYAPVQEKIMVKPSLPPRNEIGPDTPLRLSVAAELASPDGFMTVSGLRRERGTGGAL